MKTYASFANGSCSLPKYHDSQIFQTMYPRNSLTSETLSSIMQDLKNNQQNRIATPEISKIDAKRVKRNLEFAEKVERFKQIRMNSDTFLKKSISENEQIQQTLKKPIKIEVPDTITLFSDKRKMQELTALKPHTSQAMREEKHITDIMKDLFYKVEKFGRVQKYINEKQIDPKKLMTPLLSLNQESPKNSLDIPNVDYQPAYTEFQSKLEQVDLQILSYRMVGDSIKDLRENLSVSPSLAINEFRKSLYCKSTPNKAFRSNSLSSVKINQALLRSPTGVLTPKSLLSPKNTSKDSKNFDINSLISSPKEDALTRFKAKPKVNEVIEDLIKKTKVGRHVRSEKSENPLSPTNQMRPPQGALAKLSFPSEKIDLNCDKITKKCKSFVKNSKLIFRKMRTNDKKVKIQFNKMEKVLEGRNFEIENNIKREFMNERKFFGNLAENKQSCI